MHAMKLHLHSRALWRLTEWLLYAGLALTVLVVFLAFLTVAPKYPLYADNPFIFVAFL